MGTPVKITPKATIHRQTGRLNSSRGPIPVWMKALQSEVKTDRGTTTTHFIRFFKCERVLQQLIDDPDIRRSLQNIRKTLAKERNSSADERLKRFLVTASVGYHCASLRSLVRPSDRQRYLLTTGKAARKLAKTVKRDSKLFRTGTDRLPFLIARIRDPALVLPSEGEGFFKSEFTTLPEILQSFANALDAQVHALREIPKSRNTASTIYVDSLIQSCHHEFETVHYALIANIASVVIDQDFDESTIRKRPIARKLSRISRS